MRRSRIVIVGLLSVLAVAADLDAQRRPSISFDATVGPAINRTDGDYIETSGDIAADGILTLSVRRRAHAGLVIGVSASAHGGTGADDVCVAAPDGGCTPSFPVFEMVGALIGWENATATLRAMTGAAYVQADWRGWSVAWQGRLDGAVPVARHLAAVGSLRGALVPNYPRGDTFGLFAVGLGLRIR